MRYSVSGIRYHRMQAQTGPFQGMYQSELQQILGMIDRRSKFFGQWPNVLTKGVPPKPNPNPKRRLHQKNQYLLPSLHLSVHPK